MAIKNKEAVPAVVQEVETGLAIPSQFRVKKLVTRPTRTHEAGTVACLRFIGKMVSAEKKDKKTGEVTLGPPVAIVVDLENGVEHLYVCNAMTASSLNECYPDDGYVGRSFAIHKKRGKAGEFYPVDIVELED